MKILLVPLDFSDSSQRVVDQAAELALTMDARISLLHIVEPVATYVPVGASLDVVAMAPPPVQPEDIKAPLKRLEAVAEPLRTKGLQVDCEAVVGLAVDDILSHAKALNAAYIIIGSHGHGALYHLFSGSVVTGVLQHTVHPVIVVPLPHRKG
jgi:nucleotide-binding universal stress UspA family protein